MSADFNGHPRLLFCPLAAAAENAFGVAVPRPWSDDAAAATVCAGGGQPTMSGAGGGRCTSPEWR